MGRVTVAGTRPACRRHYRHTHQYRPTVHAPTKLAGQTWRRCVCGGFTAIPNPDPDPWGWRDRLILLVSWWLLNVVWRPITVTVPSLRTVRDLPGTSVRAVQTAHRTVLLSVDAWGGWRSAPSEIEIHPGDGETRHLIRTRRNGRPGFLCMDSGQRFGKFYPNIQGASGLTRYWVGGAGTWDASSTTHWSATDGGASGASAPDSGDIAKFTANCGSGTTTISNAVCRELDCTGSAAHTITIGSSTLTVGDSAGGAFKLVANITWTTSSSGTLAFVSTSNNGGTGWGITTAGKTTLPNVTFNGVGGKWVLQDNLQTNASALWTVTAGTFVSNAKNVTTFSLNSSGSGIRAIDITSSTITLSGSGAIAMAQTANLTWTATSSTINITGRSMSVAVTNGSSGLAFNTVTFTGSGQNQVSLGNATTGAASGSSFVNLTFTGTAAKTDNVQMAVTSAATVRVTGTLTMGGNTTQGVNRLAFTSQTGFSNIGVCTFDVTGGAVVISGDVIFADHDITGSPSWTNTGSKYVGDAGNNGTLITTNATVAAAQTRSGVGGNWSAVGNWTSRVPLPQDDATVNAGASGTVTIDMPYLGKTLNFTGFAGTVSWSATSTICGGITISSSATSSGTSQITLRGQGSHTITSGGHSFTPSFFAGKFIGSYTFADAFICTATGSQLNGGTWDINGQHLTWGNLIVGNSSAATLTDGGAGTLTLTATSGNPLNVSATNGTLSVASTTIEVSSVSASTRTLFLGNAPSWGTITYTVATSTGQLTLSSTGDVTAGTLNIGTGRTLALQAGRTYNVTNWNPQGPVTGSAGTTVIMPVRQTTTGYTATGIAFILTTSRVSETDTAHAGTINVVSGGVVVAGHTASETDTAHGGVPRITLPGSRASETDTAHAGSPAVRLPGARASETDTAHAGLVRIVLPGTRATETDTAHTGTIYVTMTGSRVSELDTAHAGAPLVTIPGVRVSETDTAHAGMARVTMHGSKAVEVDTPRPGLILVTIPGGHATEIDTGHAGRPVRHVGGSFAVESGSPSFGVESGTGGSFGVSTRSGGFSVKVGDDA